MVVFPNAKVNIGLNIVAKRPDGFHEIESVFYPIGVQDSLEIHTINSSSSSLNCFGDLIDGNPTDNLIFKAWQIMQDRYSLPAVSINLVKHIPMGGGIGGGSADCGFFINLVNQKFKLDLSLEDRESIAAQLGSDCPFFIQNQPAYVTGRGEKLELVSPFLSGYYMVLVYGGLHISTKEAYAGITPKASQEQLLMRLHQPIETWKYSVKNDFEAVVFAKHLALAKIKEQFYSSGAVYASLSGTGSCLFGLYKDKPQDLPLLKGKVCWEGYL